MERESEAVVGAIVKLAKALNLRVIAEGVETETQREGLRRAGCSDIQGFLYSKGLPAAEVADFAARTNSGPARPTGRSQTPRRTSARPRERLADLRR